MKVKGHGKTPRDGTGHAVALTVFGVVQGVGFRPFVYRLARELGLSGWVKNAGKGVEILLEAPEPAAIDRFVEALEERKPPLARIERIDRAPARSKGLGSFEIRKTRRAAGFVFISPDIAVCDDCLREIRTPGERRFHYAFTNCTNCGPRYTIVRDLPYDRKTTTMSGFPMCPDCAREYGDPLDRRYHAQPIACPACGPRLSLIEPGTGRTLIGDIPEAADLIRKGRILAIKGIGGFHLVCDPMNAGAVRRLRRIKGRRTKPLALMAADLATIRRYARVSPVEAGLLRSARRPIVLLEKRKDIPGIAPGLGEMGFMLPYSPLHELLLERVPLIVATSSNAKDAPIMRSEEEGIGALCDVILTHDRPIEMRADDSVVKAAGRRPLFVRRARGYVPYPQPVPEGLRAGTVIAALGGELKDTISLYKDGYVITSQFLGDLDDYRNFGYFKETLVHLERLFGARPEVLVTDLHPHFRTTRFAERSGLPHIRVQHHHAHVLAPLLEHGVPPGSKVLGVALDGYGYGEDGKAWGGEFLLADYESSLRLAHFEEVPLPGGDLASRQPWRMALSHLREAFGKDIPPVKALKAADPKKVKAVLAMMANGVASPPASSCGRLFDAVSFLCGLAPLETEYEAEAAMRLEDAAGRRTSAHYPYAVSSDGPPLRISFAPVVREIVAELGRGVPASRVSAKFHETLGRIVLDIAGRARNEYGIGIVSLAGGCFLNRRLLLVAERLLEGAGFRVLRSEAYAPNDESVSLGQIAFALARERRRKS
ncbi:MAG TPA: carbamoyltransferase HypF [Acidobacteriota bacterium]|nr:carbamoyltransferase HypF [Acidobacteriota bacterium]